MKERKLATNGGGTAKGITQIRVGKNTVHAPQIAAEALISLLSVLLKPREPVDWRAGNRCRIGGERYACKERSTYH